MMVGGNQVVAGKNDDQLTEGVLHVAPQSRIKRRVRSNDCEHIHGDAVDGMQKVNYTICEAHL